MRFAENQSFFLLGEASISQMSFLSLPLDWALAFPALAYDSIPVGVGVFLWMGRAGCLNGGEGSARLLPPREQWHCCCGRGRGDAACLRGEVLGSRGAGSSLMW